MNDTNDKTLQAYEHQLNAYIDKTPKDISGDLKVWTDTALDMLTTNAKILELGSGFGRDYKYFQSKGFNVTATDAAQSFVSYLNDNDIPAKKLNIITDNIDGNFDMVFANAVLLHLNVNEFSQAVRKVKDALNDKGILVFSVKKGEGEKWEDKKLGELRYFKYWQMEGLVKAVEESGLKVIWQLDKFSSKNADWLRVIAQKQ